MRSHTAALTLLLTALLSACASSSTPAPAAPTPAPVTGKPIKADIERLDVLVGYMTGSFDSAEQAMADRTYLNIRLHMRPIWTDRNANSDTRWLYVEQAMVDQPAKPYRQRIYRVVALGGGQFKVVVHDVPGNPLAFAGAWKTPEMFNNLKPDDLLASEGCDLLLTDRKDSFVGGTHDRDCVTRFSGAAYTTTEVTFTDLSLISWDRGYDESDKQVWGATGSGYVFRKRAR